MIAVFIPVVAIVAQLAEIDLWAGACCWRLQRLWRDELHMMTRLLMVIEELAPQILAIQKVLLTSMHDYECTVCEVMSVCTNDLTDLTDLSLAVKWIPVVTRT